MANSLTLTREEVVPSRKRVKLPPWLEIAKPRLIPLLLATTLGGMALSEGWPLPPLRLACTLGGGALAAAAAGVLNCLWEQELDGRMQRTSGRALPSGRLSITTAFAIAVTLTLTAATLLVGGVNCLAASLSLLGLCSYVLLYTVLLKPRTTQNIVIGGVAGAIPPLVGAAAATGHLGLGSWWLFALVMLWTPAHFWALPGGGLLYGLLLLPFNARLLQMTWTLQQDPDDLQRAKGLFRWSIFYLFGVCLLLLMARMPAGEQFSEQGFALLGWSGSGNAGFTLAASLVSSAF